MNRRAFLAGGTALGLVAPGGTAGAAATPVSGPFAAEAVVAMARSLASRPYAPRTPLPERWRDLGYDDYRRVWFDPARAIWGQSPLAFELDLLHPGLHGWAPVEVSVVRGGEATPMAFDPALYVNAELLPPVEPGERLGFSGLRLRHVFPGELWEREFAVFQGASYLRAIGAAQRYGLSARGLALGTGEPGPEEFPDFVAFWVEEPAPGEDAVTVHALLDGPSVAGAWRFRIAPGPACVMDVSCTILPRVELPHVGLGALTSMFLYDQTSARRFGDFRPAVHDSDGLLVHNGAGELLWRPLSNPASLQASEFADAGPRGFGLMQRSRRLSDFADLEARYERRPSLWVAPEGDWGPGAVRLVEIPAETEVHDNVVAYWRPRDPIPAGAECRFAYRLTWGDEAVPEAAPPRPDVAPVLETYLGLDFERRAIQAAIDFGPQTALDRPTPGELSPPEWVPADVAADVTAGGATVATPVLKRNPETGGTRLAFAFDPGDAPVVELRASLHRDGAPVSEVWLHGWVRA